MDYENYITFFVLWNYFHRGIFFGGTSTSNGEKIGYSQYGKFNKEVSSQYRFHNVYSNFHFKGAGDGYLWTTDTLRPHSA